MIVSIIDKTDGVERPFIMKKFLYCLTSIRDGKKDGVTVFGGTHYHHNQLLMVIEAVDIERAARALNVRVISSFDRSGVNCPTIYYTSGHYEDKSCPEKDKEGYFFLSLKELESGDAIMHPDLAEKIRLKITAPEQS